MRAAAANINRGQQLPPEGILLHKFGIAPQEELKGPTAKERGELGHTRTVDYRLVVLVIDIDKDGREANDMYHMFLRRTSG